MNERVGKQRGRRLLIAAGAALGLLAGAMVGLRLWLFTDLPDVGDQSLAGFTNS